MTAISDYLVVRLEVDANGELELIDPINISILPRIGETVECDYLHGSKVAFEVTDIRHLLSSIGENILQQITIYGKTT